MFLCESADPFKLNDPLNLHSFIEKFASMIALSLMFRPPFRI